MPLASSPPTTEQRFAPPSFAFIASNDVLVLEKQAGKVIRVQPSGNGDLVVGAGTPLLEGGYLFRFNLTGNRRKVGVDDPRLEDRVADNLAKHEITESETLLFGRDFGVTTDIQTGPNGNLYLVSLTNGALYEISRR